MRASVDQLEELKKNESMLILITIFSKIGEGRELHQLPKTALTEIGTFLD
jgi:hypothetical protein